ncbi:hypothetical protein B0H14DRAFT_2573627 [Mycena olivaceomarginata]|nr:hypothetical protein B0H14DRAFT_2573627 [Mycena olivaceomarginata]
MEGKGNDFRTICQDVKSEKFAEHKDTSETCSRWLSLKRNTEKERGQTPNADEITIMGITIPDRLFLRGYTLSNSQHSRIVSCNSTSSAYWRRTFHHIALVIIEAPSAPITYGFVEPMSVESDLRPPEQATTKSLPAWAQTIYPPHPPPPADLKFFRWSSHQPKPGANSALHTLTTLLAPLRDQKTIQDSLSPTKKWFRPEDRRPYFSGPTPRAFMPAVEVLPAITHADPLFGLIYYVLGGWVHPLLGVLAKLIFRAAHWLECGPPARRDLDIPVCSLISFPAHTASQSDDCSIGQQLFSWYTDDPIRLKISVGVLFILTILKSIQSFAITWINSILFMRDPAGTIALNREWYQIINIPLGAVIAAYVQSYYCYRLWKLSGRWFYVAPLVTVMLLGLISAIITGIIIARSGKSSNWFAIHVSCTFATDILITASSTFFLLRARQKALSHTRKLISGLIKICCQTALPATTATLIELICSRIGGKSLKPQASNSIILVLLDAVPIIYARVYLFYTSPRNILHMLTRSRSNCMLYILNTRRSLRNAGSSAGLGNSNTNQPPSGSRTRGQWRSGAGPVELSSLGGVQVRTQIETADTDGHYPLLVIVLAFVFAFVRVLVPVVGVGTCMAFRADLCLRMNAIAKECYVLEVAHDDWNGLIGPLELELNIYCRQRACAEYYVRGAQHTFDCATFACRTSTSIDANTHADIGYGSAAGPPAMSLALSRSESARPSHR